MQLFFAATYVSRPRAETRLVACLPPNHSGLGGIRVPLLPTCPCLTTCRTYSLGVAHFWDAHMLAINCKFGNMPKFSLTMANLTLPSRDIVPRGDLYHLPAKASLLHAKARFSAPSALKFARPPHMRSGRFSGRHEARNKPKKVLTRGGVAPPD